MKVYEVAVYLYEGDPITLGFYATEALANEAKDAEAEEWQGANVEYLAVHEHEVKE